MVRNKIQLIILLILGLLIPSILLAQKSQKTIKIGILHSLSGSMAENGLPLVDAAKMAIDEINSSGGLLGKPLEMIIVDGKSDWILFAKKAEELIKKDKVSAIFGCWTSACRKAVKPVVERLNNILFYPVQYEGLEQSPNIVYTGATPNQQIIPAISWALKNLGRQFYLIGSDYVFPHMANIIINDISKAQKGEVLKEQYVALSSRDFTEVIAEIKKLQPQVILNTINGDSNPYFFKQLQSAGLDNIPIISFSLSEPELEKIPEACRNNHYTVWNYFQSINNSENNRFVSQFKKFNGQDRVIGDPMESTYLGIKLWAQAVREANSADPKRVNRSIVRQSLQAPEGIISFDPETRHLWKTVRIAQAQINGQFAIIWQTKHPIRPVPYPEFRSKQQWNKLLKDFSKMEITNEF